MAIVREGAVTTWSQTFLHASVADPDIQIRGEGPVIQILR